MIRWMLVTICLAVWGLSASANDAAAETAAGGIQLRQEHSVVMEKERLFISQDLVRVEYEFRNTSQEPVTSEVAFPIPPFGLNFSAGGIRDFADFKVWVDGQLLPATKEVRAYVKEREITDALRKAGLTIEQFGRFEDEMDVPPKPSEISKLTPQTRDELVRVGALDPPDPADAKDTNFFPLWDVHVTYHWTQTFPPNKVVKVKHEYRPGIGFELSQPEVFEKDHPDTCLDQKSREYIQKRVAELVKADPHQGGYCVPTWVKYILTTANTWQGPIRDFELIVQKPKDSITSFCWDGPVEKVDARTFRMRQKDFTPEHELCVYFFEFR